jgi:hypothetical protein
MKKQVGASSYTTSRDTTFASDLAQELVDGHIGACR